MATLGNTPRSLTMMALEARKSFALGIKFKHASDDSPVDITGCTIQLDVALPKRKGGSIALSKVATILDGDLGLAQFELQADDLDLASEAHPFAVTLVTALGYSTLVLKGEVDVRDNISTIGQADDYAGISPSTNLAAYFSGGDLVTVKIDSVDGLYAQVTDILVEAAALADAQVAAAQAAAELAEAWANGFGMGTVEAAETASATITGPALNRKLNLKLPKGDQGNPGAKGDAGTPGAKGDKGNPGDPGAPGAKGDRGNDGQPGPKGDKGEPGEKGDKGDKGLDGQGSGTVTSVAGVPDDNGNVPLTAADIDARSTEELIPWSQIADTPTSLPPGPHEHDERYYTKAQGDSRYAALAHDHSSIYYTKSQSDSAVTSAINTHKNASDPHGDRAYTDTKISDLIGGAPGILDTLGEIAAALAQDDTEMGAITAAVNARLVSTNNLSDLTDASVARTNLGLGTAATRSVGSASTSVAAGNRGAPAGGTTGQVLAKTSATDYALGWVDGGGKPQLVNYPLVFQNVGDATWTAGVAGNINTPRALAVLNDEIWVIYATNAALRKWNPVTQTYTTIAGSTVPAQGEGQFEAFDNKLYVMGGSNDPTAWWEYDPSLNTWSASMYHPNGGNAKLVGLGDYLYAFGGRNTSNVALNTVWRWSKISRTWTSVTNMPISGTVTIVKLDENRCLVMTNNTSYVFSADTGTYSSAQSGPPAVPNMATWLMPDGLVHYWSTTEHRIWNPISGGSWYNGPNVGYPPASVNFAVKVGWSIYAWPYNAVGARYTMPHIEIDPVLTLTGPALVGSATPGVMLRLGPTGTPAPMVAGKAGQKIYPTRTEASMTTVDLVLLQ